MGFLESLLSFKESVKLHSEMYEGLDNLRFAKLTPVLLESGRVDWKIRPRRFESSSASSVSNAFHRL